MIAPDGYYDLLLTDGSLVEQVHVLAVGTTTADVEIKMFNGRWRETFVRLDTIADAAVRWMSKADAAGARVIA